MRIFTKNDYEQSGQVRYNEREKNVRGIRKICDLGRKAIRLAKEEFVADAIAWSPGSHGSANRRCILAAEASGSSGCESSQCNSVSFMFRHWLPLHCH